MMILQQTRGALSSGDQLALDLPFAATKSLAARIGPTPTFTRGSGATYVGSDGLIHGVDTSTTSNTIGTGSKTFTLAVTAGQDQLYRTGDAVEAANGVNLMIGTVTSYTPSTQVLVCNITSVTGSGTFTSWRIGYRGPRFDHAPVSPFVCRGLLIEEGRTNLVLQSENFGTTWTSVNLNQTGTPPYLNVETAPDGATTADKLIATTTNGTHQFRQSVTLVSGTSYTISVYFKAAGTNFAAISVFGVANGSTDWDAFFNISASSPAAGQFLGFTSTSLVDVGNGWRRCSVTFTATASGSLSVRLGGATSTNLNSNSYAGDGTSGIFIWGAQLEAGSFPTSYIPTTTTALARAADTCSITGGAFNSFYNQSEGTLFADVSGLMNTTLSGNRPFVSITDGTYQNYIQINKAANSGLLNATGTVSNLAQFNFSNPYSPSTQYKVALGFKTNDANTAFNGTLGTTDTSVTMPSTMNRLELRDPTGAAGGQPTGHIAAIRYYKKRLANAKLQALTA